MKIRFHLKFQKSYRSRIYNNKKLVLHTEQRIELFRTNPDTSILKDHALSGSKKGLRAFSITGDIRIIYQNISEEEVIFMDIGSHNQVY